MFRDLAPQLLHRFRHPTGRRYDANETASFTRALEYVEQEVYRIQYPEIRIRDFIPLNTRVPPGAETFLYRVWDWFGMAKIIANGADDLPRIGVHAIEKAQVVRTFADAYDYTIDDMNAAALMNMPLDSELGSAAKRGCELLIDSIGARGDTKTDLPGFLNNPNVPVLTTTELVGDWLNPATTAAQILADLNIIANQVAIQTKNAYVADTLLLPQSHFLHVNTTPFSATDSRSIAMVFTQNHPTLKTIDQWYHLETADSAGTGPRAVAYARRNEVVELVIPQDFTQQPPQPRNLSFTVPCWGRIGGVIVRYPLAIVYADDI